MTGRELILWILVNHLEDEPVFQNGSMSGFKTVDQYAADHGIGPATVLAYIQMGCTPHIKIGDTIYIPDVILMESDFKQ